MTAMRKNSSLITILAFGLYFLVGAGALLVGSSLTQLIGVYGRTMDAVVLLGSSFAIGRVSTVGLTGRLVEKIGAKAVYAISVRGHPAVPQLLCGDGGGLPGRRRHGCGGCRLPADAQHFLPE